MLSMMHLLTVTCFILAINFQLTVPVYSPARRGRRMYERTLGYCDIYPHCTCVGSRLEYNVYCEGEVNILFEHIPPRRRVTIHCNPKAGPDVFKYLSILRISSSTIQGIDVGLHSCPLPTDGYANLFYAEGKKNSTLDFRPSSIEKLFIHCVEVKDFKLNGQHLIGLESLSVLGIFCSGLSRIDPELLNGVSRGLIEFRVTESFAEIIPSGLVKNHSSLQILELKNLGLKVIPKGFLGPAKTMRHFSIEGNEIEELDDDIFRPIEYLFNVDLSENRLISLPNSVCKRPELITMDIKNNELTHLDPECFHGCDKLSSLYLGGNKLRSFHPTLLMFAERLRFFHAPNNLIGIEVFVISNDSKIQNGTIESFSSEDVRFNITSSLDENFFANNVDLFDVSFRNNAINILPEKIFHNNHFLFSVDLSNNKLKFLPEKLFEKNRELRYIDLSNNYLVDVSDYALSNLSLLHTFSLAGNLIKSMGARFFHDLSSLKVVDLSNCQLETLSDDIFLPFNKSEKLLSLQLSKNILESLPLLSLPSVTHLNLDQNKLVNLTSDTFKLMSSLEFLNISHNLIQSIGLMTFNSGKIISIDLSNNLIHASIADDTCASPSDVYRSVFRERYGLRKLKNSNPPQKLEYLNLSNNSIVSFYTFHRVAFGSDELREDKSIVTLDLSRNKISFNDSEPILNYKKRIWGFESRLAVLKSLEVLLLAYNEIQMLPLDWRHDLPSLRYLDLRHNKIKYLWYQDLFFSNGVLPGQLPTKYFIPRESYLQFSNAHKLTVDLRHNLIKGMELQNAMMIDIPKGCLVDEEFGHATLLLGNNPFECDCHVYQLLRYAEKEVRPISQLEKNTGSKFILPAKIDISGLSCWIPHSVRGKMILEPETWSHHLLPLLEMCHGIL